MLEDNTIELSWQSASAIKSSETYELNVTLTKILYHQANDCSIANLESKIFSSNRTFYVLNNLVPFSKYSFSVKSVSSSKYSEASSPITFRTKPTKPTKPRDPEISFFDNESDDHVKGIIKWKTPCEVNGNSLTYLIHLIGKRKHYDHHIIIEEVTSEQFETSKFKRGYHYDAHIKAKNQKFIGDNLEMNFFTPSGIPTKIDNAIRVSNQNELKVSQLDVYVRNAVFKSSVGDITGATFLIFNAVSC